MASPLVYTDVLQELHIKIDRLEHKLDIINKKLDDDTFFETSEPHDEVSNHETTDQYIKERGKNERVSYNKIYLTKEVKTFKEFLYDVKRNPKSIYTEEELEYVDRADKNFRDIRLSNNHMRILINAYRKCYGKDWPFKTVKGYLYQWEGDKTWEWFPENREA